MATFAADAHNNNVVDCDEVDFVASTNKYNYNYNNNNNNNNNDIIKKCDYMEHESGHAELTALAADITATKALAQLENVPNMMISNSTATNTTKTTTATRTVPNSTNANGNSAPTTPKQKHKKSLFTFGKHKSGSQKTQKGKTSDAPAQQDTTTTAQQEEEQKVAQHVSNGMTDMQTDKPIGTPPNAARQHKFVKSSSIARLLGNTYNAKKFEKAEQKRKTANDKKFHTYAAGQRRRRDSGAYLERFKDSKDIDNGDVLLLNHTSSGDGIITLTTDTRELFADGTRNELVAKEKPEKQDYSADLGSRAMRTLTRGLGKLWWKRSHSVDISAPDPEYKVSYLGNVLTGWAKGEGCVEKQLNTLWRNYTQNNKPDVIMRIKVCASGLKATTRQHGLTEYWANRITHCCAPKNYPRVFCWIYRHEGRKLKHELRCHAVLCSKEKIVQEICETLKENLEAALREFKREKILKQNARLSLANAVYDNPSLPRRKILLSVGGNNYRPPLERSKSAPKLTAIEEAIGEEDGEEVEETNEPEMMPCCQKDSLYPAMTLGRRRCRRGHSIRRTGKVKLSFDCATLPKTKERCCANAQLESCKELTGSAAECKATGADMEGEQRHSYGSDESDEFDKLLRHNDYDASATLTTELMPYFDMQLHKNTSCSLGSLTELKEHAEPLSLIQTINSDPNAHPNAEYHPNAASHEHDADTDVESHENGMVGLRRTGVCSDGEEDYLDEDDLYFRQNSILNMLHRHSMRKMAALNLSSDEGSLETHANFPQHRHQAQSSICSNASSTATDASSSASTSGVGKQANNMDSDEGSISSGCETASTVTANQDDVSFSYRQSKVDMQHNEYGILDEEQPITADDIYERLEARMQGRNNSDAGTFSSSSTITLKMGTSPNGSMQNELDALQQEQHGTTTATAMQRNKRTRKQAPAQRSDIDSDSECSDESGYVEYQERTQKQNNKNASNHTAASVETNDTLPGDVVPVKPQVPPKPMPRRSLSIVNTTTTV